jgi:DNA-binding NarL/FixJ family response regulator
MGTLKRILIVDSHPLFRITLRKYLSQERDFQIVGVVGNMRDAIWAVGSLGPDLVLTELTMPDARGVEAVAGIKRHYPEVKVLVLSFQRENEFVHRCRDAGAAGYVVKDAIHDDLCDVIRAVLEGKNFLDADAAGGPGADSPQDTAAFDRNRALLLQQPLRH